MKRQRRLGRRGFMVDTIFLIVLLFMVCVGGILTYYIMGTINDAVQSSTNFETEGKTMMNTQTGRFDNVMDATVLILFIGMISALMITSYVLQTNPLIFSLVLLVVVIMGGIAGYLSNAYEFIISDPLLSATSNSFPITNFLMNNYLVIMVILIFAMLIVFFAKPGGSGY